MQSAVKRFRSFFHLVIWAVFVYGSTAQSATVDDVVKSVRDLSPAKRKAVIEEGARKEGEVIWYTSMSLTDFPKIVAAFEKTAPHVKVRTNRLSQSSVMPKIDTEARAGRFLVDVVASAPL
jgi:ABC-type glycerol-3-phosphate transport system substrate-binding protein